jgi:hypothetical protein
VVQLTTIIGDFTLFGKCTGTFIAKNWIVTAAHCLAEVTDPSLKPGDAGFDLDAAASNPDVRDGRSKGARELFGYTKYRFRWPNASGDVTFGAPVEVTANTPDVLQYPDMRWVGGRTSAFDFALLYLDKEHYDPILPRRSDLGAAMRISLSPPPAGKLSFVAGYAPSQTHLTASSVTGVTALPRRFEAIVPSADAPQICGGDSGGPLYQLIDIAKIGEPPNVVPALMGVTNFVRPLDPDVDADCSTTGDTLGWWRIAWDPTATGDAGTVDDEVAFIQRTMAFWNGGSFTLAGVSLPVFECKADTSLNSAAPDFLQCWGNACTSADDCAENEFCSDPGLEIHGTSRAARCNVCGSRGNCLCIFGECLPRPPVTTNDAGDARAD